MMFKTFPEFSALTFADKTQYEALIKEYPPVYDITFAGMMSWWNHAGDARISQLNGNLIVSFWLPGDDKHSGLSLIGNNAIDESICAIFDHLATKGERPRLINVPEFVVSAIRYPEMFTFKEDRFYHEYILPIARFYPLENMTDHRRRKVERLIEKVGKDKLVVKSLDLRARDDRQFLLDITDEWRPKNINDYGKVEAEAIKTCILHAHELETENACLFVDGVLYGYCLYHRPRQDRRYVTIRHIKATHKNSLGFEVMAYVFARQFAELGVEYADIGPDLGLMRLRMFMLTLGPINFFRKYRIEPA